MLDLPLIPSFVVQSTSIFSLVSFSPDSFALPMKLQVVSLRSFIHRMLIAEGRKLKGIKKRKKKKKEERKEKTEKDGGNE